MPYSSVGSYHASCPSRLVHRAIVSFVLIAPERVYFRFSHFVYSLISKAPIFDRLSGYCWLQHGRCGRLDGGVCGAEATGKNNNSHQQQHRQRITTQECLILVDRTIFFFVHDWLIKILNANGEACVKECIIIIQYRSGKRVSQPKLIEEGGRTYTHARQHRHRSAGHQPSTYCICSACTRDLILMKDESHQRVSISADKCTSHTCALFSITAPCTRHISSIFFSVFFGRELIRAHDVQYGYYCVDGVMAVHVESVRSNGAGWMRRAILIAIFIDVRDY